MNTRHFFGVPALLFMLSGCGGGLAGIGSLVMQSLQLAGGGASDSGSGKNRAPSTRTDRAQELRELDDVTSRGVSQSCLAAKEGMAFSLTSSVTSDALRQCAYRDVCLPGHARPARMLVCEKPSIAVPP